MLTIGIKTFCRPHTLDQCLDIMLNNNNIHYPIIIADDSLDEYKKQNIMIVDKYRKINKDIQIIDMPFDSGLSKGRNTIVQHCKSKYIMILDDSRTFDKSLKIDKMLEFLETNQDYHLFGGVINQRKGQNRKYAALFGDIKKINNIINIKCLKPKSIKSNIFPDIEYTNICVNVFISKTECLRDVKWRDELKLGEHKAFFYDFYKKKYKCVISNSCNFIQVNRSDYPKDLAKYRARAHNMLNPIRFHNFLS